MNVDSFISSHHGISAALYSASNFLLYIIEKFFEAGRSAVMLFFVLSGFVLAYSLQEQPTSYVNYLIKRFFRIYPVFAFTVIFSFIVHDAIGIQSDASSPWVRYLLSGFDTSFSYLAAHLAMLGSEKYNKLDPPMWSIVHEMRISLIFPLILLSVRKFRSISVALYLVFSLLCALYRLHLTNFVPNGIGDHDIVESFISTGYFIIFFAGGAYLALERQPVAQKLAHFSAWKKAPLSALCIYCILKTDFDFRTLAGVVVDYMRGFAAISLIALALGTKRLQTALNHGIFLWLGRISYSLYLIHFVVIYLVNVLNEDLGEIFSVSVRSIFIVVLSLAGAELMNRAIEVPFMKYGKKLSAKMA